MAMEKHVVNQLKIAGNKASANENCYVTQTPSTLLESLPYYYGCISREDAEWILYDEGCPDGMYLLRESGNDFVLSLCHHNSVLHYRISKLPTGEVALQGLPNQTFPSPMELIETVDGLACKPNRPLKAQFGKCLPPTHWKLSEESIREQLILRSPNWGMTPEEMRDSVDCDLHFSSTFSPLIRSLIIKSMHEIQPWYHYRLSRTEAERRIESSGHRDGKFLVRERDESSYAICLSHDSRVKHYRIDILPSGNFAIQDGPKFESLIALISHYTIFSGGLWCMLGEGCPRPQEIIRQYAEQSNAQISSLVQLNQTNSHYHHQHHHHHHHGHSHGQHHSATSSPYQVQNNHVLLAIHRGHDPLEFNEKCKACLQLFPHRHRSRRVSTPTNLKLKEWFTTINHKWARIKRQVILHHQRQQPLINEDNYDSNEISCCHVSKLKNANQKAKNLKELLNGRNEPYRIQSNLHFQCKCLSCNRYLNGYATSRYAYRKQQFGRWHEEPAFGSRYAFDNEPYNRQTSSVTNTPSAKTRLNTLQNDLNYNNKSTQASDDIDVVVSANNATAAAAATNAGNDMNRPSLIKSSSIDTIAAFFNDPIEEIRRLHFRPLDDSNSMNGNGFYGGNSRTPFDAELMHITTCNSSTNKLLQRTNSFDGTTSAAHCHCNCSDWLLDVNDMNDPFQSLPETDLAKNECLQNLNDENAMKELQNVFASNAIHPSNSVMVNGMNHSLTNDLLLSSSNNHSLNADQNFVFNCELNGFQSPFGVNNPNPLSTKATSQSRPFANLNGPLSSGEDELAKQDNIDIVIDKNHHHLNNKTTTAMAMSGTSSSSSNSGGSSSMSTSSANSASNGSNTGAVRISNRSFVALATVPSSSSCTTTTRSLNNNNSSANVDNKNGHLSFHSTSLRLNSDLMDPNFFLKSDEINHSSSSSSSTTTTTTTSIVCTNSNHKTTIPSLVNAVDMGQTTKAATGSETPPLPPPPPPSGSNPSTSILSSSHRPPIIDLLKEFDVCFNNHDNIDDDSSTLTDNSSHSLNSPPKSNKPEMNNENINKSSMVLQLSSNDAAGNTISNNKSYHKSSLPPPTISPPPPPSMCSMVETWPNNEIASSSTPSKTSMSANGNSFNSSQQVPLGRNDNNKNGENNSSQQERTSSNEHCLKDIELICLNEVIEEVQETIQKCKRGPICFDPRCITLKRRIGNGYFGDVFLATIPSLHNSANINLAVKMLKSHAVPQQKAEILREAQTMAKLDHRHIVRLIGVCENDPFMLVMELAPLGPLNKYLQNHGQNMTDDDILKLMLQVAKAMQYLEEMNYVHRDLAARNILLVNEKFAKVSDFGMSRALGQGKDYYKARSASKWPLKWYAPECIYYYKFSSKSDVWSFGVALWEAMSRGEMPYQGMDGQDILRMFNENRRLPKPENCSVIIYQIMWSCWQFKPEDRLNFANITDQLIHHLNGK